MTSAYSAAEQKDSILRIYANYKLNFDRAIITTKVAYFNEYQFYHDSLYYIDASYNLKNYLGEIETRLMLSDRISMTTGVSFANTSAHIPEYKSTKKRTGYSIFTGVNVNPWPSWIFTLSARKEFQVTGENKNPPLAPSFGAEGNLVKEKIFLKVNAGRHYTLPTLNDLYWVPGGNPDLLPEDAWSAEAGLLFTSKDNRRPRAEITFFNSLTDNWIKWQPGAGGIYEPGNLKQVHSRGIEFSGSQNFNIRTVKIKSVLLYTWCKSTNSGTYEIYGEPTIDKQLIYIPEHIARFNIEAVAGTFSVNLNHGFTSHIYTSSDNSTSLKEYFIADYSLQKTFLLKDNKFITYFQVMNVFDASYQVIAWRPMPGRWFMAGVKAEINFRKK
jgi:iron complex outermembrane receptor protein